MAEVDKGTVPSLCTPAPSFEHQITGFLCAEDIAAGDACYVDKDNEMIMLADGSAADEEAVVWGFAPRPAKAGQALTLFKGVNFNYSAVADGTDDLLAIGTKLYLSGTVPGGLADAASTGGTEWIAIVLDSDGRLYCRGNLH